MKTLNQRSEQSILPKNIVKNFKHHFIDIMIPYLFVMLILLSSCSSDDSEISFEDQAEDPVVENPILPEITLQSGSTDLFLGVLGGSSESVLNHSIKTDASEGLISLKISRVLNGEITEYETISEGHPDYSKGLTSHIYQLDYIFSDEDVEQELYFLAEVLDEQGNTTSLKFAEALVKMPLIENSFTLRASKNGAFDPLLNYYLFVDGETVQAATHDKAILEENDKKVVAILSFNENAEFYLASPTDVDEVVLTDAMLEIARTKFKYDILSDQPLANTFNPFDVHTIDDNYEDLLFAEKDERLEKLQVGNRFYIKTEDDRIAILQLRKVESLEPAYTAFTFDILITQKP